MKTASTTTASASTTTTASLTKQYPKTLAYLNRLVFIPKKEYAFKVASALILGNAHTLPTISTSISTEMQLEVLEKIQHNIKQDTKKKAAKKKKVAKK